MKIPQNFAKLFVAWLDKAEPHRARPELAKILKLNNGSGKNKYSASVRLLEPATLEETETIIDDVGISPIWAGKKGQGIYAPPEKDSLVIVDFIQGNRAFPFVSSIYGQEYGAASFSTGEFLITDGSVEIRISGGKVFVTDGNANIKLGGKVGISTTAGNLKAILDDVLQALQTAKTIPAAPGAPLTLSPDTIALFVSAKAKLATVLE